MGVVTLTNYEDIARIKIISSYQERIRDISNSNNGCLKPGYIFDLAIFYTYLICNAFRKLSCTTQFLLSNFLSEDCAIRFCNLTVSDSILNKEESDFIESVVLKVSSDNSMHFIKRSILMLKN